MGRMIVYGVLVIGSFGLAAGGSWFLSQKDDQAEETDEKAGEESAENSEESTDADSTDSKSEKKPSQPQASAVPPRPMSAEDLYRIGEIMKAREEAIKNREAALEKTDRQLKLVLIDIDAEQRETDGVLTEVRGTLDAATRALQQFQLEKQNAPMNPEPKNDANDAEDKGDGDEPTPDQIKQAKRLAVVYQNMAPEQAAAKLTNIADDGNLELVVRISRYFEERKAAKILAGLDAPLHTEIVTKLSELKQIPKKAN